MDYRGIVERKLETVQDHDEVLLWGYIHRPTSEFRSHFLCNLYLSKPQLPRLQNRKNEGVNACKMISRVPHTKCSKSISYYWDVRKGNP